MRGKFTDHVGATWASARAAATPAVMFALAIAGAATTGCGAEQVAPGELGVEDLREEQFLFGGVADIAEVAEGSAHAIGVLRVANESSRVTFTQSVGLSERAADALLAYRVGDDEQIGTSDDEIFTTLAELDAVPYIGPTALQALLDYAVAKGLVPDCVSTCTDETHLLDCSLGGAVIACPLGCEEGVCQAFAPSNLVPENLHEVFAKGVTASLTVPTMSSMEVDVDTGAISGSVAGVIRRPGKEVELYGVRDGIGFYRSGACRSSSSRRSRSGAAQS